MSNAPAAMKVLSLQTVLLFENKALSRLKDKLEHFCGQDFALPLHYTMLVSSIFFFFHCIMCIRHSRNKFINTAHNTGAVDKKVYTKELS